MTEVIGIFRHKTLEKFLQIVPRGGISIFHDDDAATGVLNKNRDRSILDVALVDLRLYVISDFVEAFPVRVHFKLIMINVHFRTLRFLSCRARSRHISSNGKRSSIKR